MMENFLMQSISKHFYFAIDISLFSTLDKLILKNSKNAFLFTLPYVINLERSNILKKINIFRRKRL